MLFIHLIENAFKFVTTKKCGQRNQYFLQYRGAFDYLLL